MGKIIVLAIIAIIIFFIFAWLISEKDSLAECKQKYGDSYILGHSTSNSSIKWCQSPAGDMKAL